MLNGQFRRILEDLHQIGVRGDALRWTSSYLTDRTVCQCWWSPIVSDTAATRSSPGQRVGPPTLLSILCWPVGGVLKAWYPISRICGWHAVTRRFPAWRFCLSCRPDTALCYRRLSMAGITLPAFEWNEDQSHIIRSTEQPHSATTSPLHWRMWM